MANVTECGMTYSRHCQWVAWIVKKVVNGVTRVGAWNGGAENAGVEKSGVDSRGGKCGSDNGWKAVRKEKYKIPTT